MKLIMNLSRDEVEKMIPYHIVAETMCGPRWDTGSRRRLQNEWFTVAEISALKRLKNLAERWALKTGIPEEGVSMTMETYYLWKKLELFCHQL